MKAVRRIGIDAVALRTNEGISRIAVEVASALQEDVITPLLAIVPMEKHPVLFERIFSGIAGIACSEIGTELAKRALDEVKLAIDAAAAARAKAHVH